MRSGLRRELVDFLLLAAFFDFRVPLKSFLTLEADFSFALGVDFVAAPAAAFCLDFTAAVRFGALLSFALIRVTVGLFFLPFVDFVDAATMVSPN